jgi:hypothetical protein
MTAVGGASSPPTIKAVRSNSESQGTLEKCVTTTSGSMAWNKCLCLKLIAFAAWNSVKCSYAGSYPGCIIFQHSKVSSTVFIRTGII